MKLYEFIVTDRHNNSDERLDYYAALSLEEEAGLLGWTPGFSVVRCPNIVQLEDGAREIRFEVFGEYLDENGERDERVGASVSDGNGSDGRAAREAET